MGGNHYINDEPIMVWFVNEPLSNTMVLSEYQSDKPYSCRNGKRTQARYGSKVNVRSCCVDVLSTRVVIPEPNIRSSCY